MTGGATVGKNDCGNEIVIDLLYAVAEKEDSQLFKVGKLSGSKTGKL